MRYYFTALRNVKGVVKSWNFSVHRSSITKVDGKWIVDLKYGYEHTTQTCIEGFDSVIPGQKYELHRQVRPKEGDVISYKKSGRVFKVGKVTGFILYTAPLYEDGLEVAILKFEDYYKD